MYGLHSLPMHYHQVCLSMYAIMEIGIIPLLLVELMMIFFL